MAKTNEELDRLQSRLKSLYHEALVSGVCNSQKSFAEIIGTKPQSLSSAMNRNERFLTESLIIRAEHALGKSHSMVNMDNSHDNVQEQKNFAPASDDSMVEIVRTFTDSLREERESHERIMMALIEKFGKN